LTARASKNSITIKRLVLENYNTLKAARSDQEVIQKIMYPNSIS